MNAKQKINRIDGSASSHSDVYNSFAHVYTILLPSNFSLVKLISGHYPPVFHYLGEGVQFPRQNNSQQNYNLNEENQFCSTNTLYSIECTKYFDRQFKLFPSASWWRGRLQTLLCIFPCLCPKQQGGPWPFALQSSCDPYPSSVSQ